MINSDAWQIPFKELKANYEKKKTKTAIDVKKSIFYMFWMKILKDAKSCYSFWV